MTYFSEVHNNFDRQLTAAAADVSEQEIRLAAFLRMNLSTKEIASIFNVLPSSVLKSEYRLKKKLGLTRKEDLGRYLNSSSETHRPNAETPPEEPERLAS